MALKRDRVTEYALSVANGDVVACQSHIKACQRHLRDLERQRTADFPYEWRPEAAERFLDFAGQLTLLEGFQPRKFDPLGFQAFDLGCPFGWYNADGYRRFRRKYKTVARQNGKTLENGITLPYIAGFSGYKYGKIFTVATKRDQAKLAWDEVHKFICADPNLAEFFDVREYKYLITALQTHCTIEALSRDRALMDGFRGLAASIDEIHQHPNNGIYKAIYNGSKNLPEVLISMITTRGFRQNSFCGEMDRYALNILDGVATAEDFFVDVFTLDKNDHWQDETVWIKSNPYLASTPHGMKTLRIDAQTAADMGGSDLQDFLVKSMNLWPRNEDNQYIIPEWWTDNAHSLQLSDFSGQPCYVGLDLSSGGDLTSVSLIFPRDGEFFLFSHSFMPLGRFEEHIKTDLAPYDVWGQEGLLTLTGGSTDFKNDFSFIISYLSELKERYNLQFSGIGYDPHNADGFLASLDAFGCPLVMVTQSARNLCTATEDFRLQLKSGKVHGDGANGLLTWSVCNARVVKNSFGEIKIDKEPNAKKKRIDPVDAMLDAYSLAMKPPAPTRDPNDEMQFYLKGMGWH